MEDEPVDALDTLAVQNRLVGEMLDEWDRENALLARLDQSDRAERADSVDARWKRGSAVKLLLQHLAVREAAKEDVRDRLLAMGWTELAEKLDAAGTARRARVAEMDRVIAGHQGINLGFPEVDEAVSRVAEVFRAERSVEDSQLIPAAAGLLGQPGERGLPGTRSVQMRSVTRPSPSPKWHDRVKWLKAVRAFYDHLRSAPSGIASPSVDAGREHTPGPKLD